VSTLIKENILTWGILERFLMKFVKGRGFFLHGYGTGFKSSGLFAVLSRIKFTGAQSCLGII